MNPGAVGPDIIADLKRASGARALYHRTIFLGERQTRTGEDQEFELEILDAGPQATDTRYCARATSEDGKRAYGNDATSPFEAVALMHWGDLE